MPYIIASIFQELPPQLVNVIGEFFITVGTAVGAPAHIAKVAGGAISALTACGVGTGSLLVGVRVFWPQQISCDDCRREYLEKAKRNRDQA